MNSRSAHRFPHYWVALAGTLLLCAAVTVPTTDSAAADPKADAKKTDAKAGGDKGGEPPAAYGHICETSISYLWKAGAPGAKNLDSVKPRKVFFSTINEQGASNDDVKVRLEHRIDGMRAKALEACRAEHQTEASCFSKKLNTLATDYPLLGYEQRAMMIKSIKSDCGLAEGHCTSTDVSEMKCWLHVSPEVVVPNEPKIEVQSATNTKTALMPETRTIPAADAPPVKSEPEAAAAAAPNAKAPAATKNVAAPNPAATPEPSSTSSPDNPYKKAFNF